MQNVEYIKEMWIPNENFKQYGVLITNSDVVTEGLLQHKFFNLISRIYFPIVLSDLYSKMIKS